MQIPVRVINDECHCDIAVTEPELHINRGAYICAVCHKLVPDDKKVASDQYWGFSGMDDED